MLTPGRAPRARPERDGRAGTTTMMAGEASRPESESRAARCVWCGRPIRDCVLCNPCVDRYLARRWEVVL